MTLLFRCLSALVLLLLPLTASAQQVNLRGPFNANAMSSQDIRFLQGVLALTEDYDGLMNGRFNDRTRQALDAYMRRELGLDRYSFADMRPLLEQFIESEGPIGWKTVEWIEDEMSLVLPAGLLTEGSTQNNDAAAVLEGPDTSLRVAFTDQGFDKMRDQHDRLLSNTASSPEAYTLRRDDRWVTAILHERDNQYVYLRSDRIDGIYQTVRLRVDPPEQHRLQMIASSIARGPGMPFSVTEGGVLWQIINGSPEPAPVEPEPRPRVGPAVGSGVYINSTDILTGARLLDYCPEPRLGERRLRRVAVNDELGLMLLSNGPRSEAWAPIGSERLNHGARMRMLVPGANDSLTERPAQVLTRGNDWLAPGQARLEVQSVPGSVGAALADDRGHLVGLTLSGREIEGPDVGNGREIVIGAEAIGGFLSSAGVLYEPRFSGFSRTAPAPLQEALVSIQCD
ncbi:hypothetical protein OG2516_07962 [Oceanicola granulosus HTCC2516]|uniref:Peptidoglycan binding-like domain-containing protein n=1 Tax=Oceanicola granulosus (strain ATCC BAA-861 / DSM 15982 / KCTC 12143 / HTCC2516) TaxID=314256 RepID=Q2CI62_OCEGH|nr:serine protease [Oceanicola granulosus]EAR52396.1 hypothetical protein OG2516_07962 [Oceanicola granulosus HTCC2516]